MSDRPPVRLTPVPIHLGSPEFFVVAGWSFSEPFVGRLLQSDIPQRFGRGKCSMWVYRDQEDRLVGFGTLDLCFEYAEETQGQIHPYIPLLVVNQIHEGRGYGQFILRHLKDDAPLFALEGICADVLFLDVYITSEKAIRLYEKSGFVRIGGDPIPDEMEVGLTYIVMARRTSIASESVSMFMEGAPP